MAMFQEGGLQTDEVYTHTHPPCSLAEVPKAFKVGDNSLPWRVMKLSIQIHVEDRIS